MFTEIEKAYNGEKSVFDDISQDDLIMAFFPCTYFSDQSLRHLNSQAAQLIKCSIEEKCENAIKRHKQISNFYEVLNKFVILSQRNKFKLVIENPYSTNGLHYLKNFWFLKPQIIDKDRTKNGDYFIKPTQYWFINCEPKHNLIFEPLEYVETKRVKEHWLPQVERSMIHPQYANRFIRQYIIDE